MTAARRGVYATRSTVPPATASFAWPMSNSSEAPNGSKRARALELAAWIGLFVAARMALVLAFGDVFAYLEEFEKAAAGKAMLDGLALAHHQLAYHPYEGGGFVVSHLDALVFALAGPSVLSVKLVALLLGALLLAGGWGLCFRAAGPIAARVFAALYVLAPASMQQNSLLALGIHYHALIFVGALLWAVLAALDGGAQQRRVWLASGLIAGFGVFFSYQLGLTVLVALGAGVFVARRAGSAVALRGLGWASAGAALGALPLWWMWVRTGRAVFDIHGTDVLSTKAPRAQLLGDFAESFFLGRQPHEALALALLCAAPFSALWAWRSGARARTFVALIAVHAALFCAAYLGLGFTIGRVVSYFMLQRLTPLWFFGLLATAVGCAALWNAGGVRRRAGLALALSCALVGALDLVRLVRAAAPRDWLAHARVLASTKGYAYPQYLQKLAPRLGLEREALARTFLDFEEEDRELLLDALSNTVWGDGSVELEQLEREASALGLAQHSADRRALLAAQGMALRNRWGGDIASRLERAAQTGDDRAEFLAEAIGRFGGRYFPSFDAVRRELDQGVAATAPAAFFFGLGMRAWAARGDASVRAYPAPTPGPWCFDQRGPRALFEAQAPEVRAALFAGYEHARKLHTLDGVDSSR